MLTIIVDHAEPYDNETPKPGPSIIATFNGDNNEDFEIEKNTQGITRLKVSVNESASAGTYYFPLKLIINETEEKLDPDLALLTIEPIHDFEIDIGKRSVKEINPGDRVDFGITIKNNGNVEEEIFFDFQESSEDLQYFSLKSEENLKFSENPLIIPIFNQFKGEIGERTTDLVINVPEQINKPKYYNIEIIKIELKIIAISTKGINEEETILLTIREYIPKDPPTQHIHPEPENKWPLRRLLLIIPIFIFLGGLVVVVISHKRKEQKPFWKNEIRFNRLPNVGYQYNNPYFEQNQFKQKSIIHPISRKQKNTLDRNEKFNPLKTMLNIQKIPAKPTTIKCQKCKSILTILPKKRPLDIACPKCDTKIRIF